MEWRKLFEEKRTEDETVQKTDDSSLQKYNSSKGSVQLDSKNIGFKMLKNMGWNEGLGLGKSEKGNINPVEITTKANKKGLGSE